MLIESTHRGRVQDPYRAAAGIAVTAGDGAGVGAFSLFPFRLSSSLCNTRAFFGEVT